MPCQDHPITQSLKRMKAFHVLFYHDAWRSERTRENEGLKLRLQKTLLEQVPTLIGKFGDVAALQNPQKRTHPPSLGTLETNQYHLGHTQIVCDIVNHDGIRTLGLVQPLVEPTRPLESILSSRRD
jgi:hypothetical protein